MRDGVAQPGVVRRVMFERIHRLGVRPHCGVVLRGFHGARPTSMRGGVVWNLPPILVAPHQPPLFFQHITREVQLLGLTLELDDCHFLSFSLSKKEGR